MKVSDLFFLVSKNKLSPWRKKNSWTRLGAEISAHLDWAQTRQFKAFLVWDYEFEVGNRRPMSSAPVSINKCIWTFVYVCFFNSTNCPKEYVYVFVCIAISLTMWNCFKKGYKCLRTLSRRSSSLSSSSTMSPHTVPGLTLNGINGERNG